MTNEAQTPDAKLREAAEKYIGDTVPSSIVRNYIIDNVVKAMASREANEYWQEQNKPDFEVNALAKKLLDEHLKHGFELESFKTKEVKLLEISFNRP